MPIPFKYLKGIGIVFIINKLGFVKDNSDIKKN